MLRLFLAVVLVFASTACVSVPKVPPGDGERITVRYSPGGPICDSCHEVAIHMTSDGRAIFQHWFSGMDYSREERRRIPFTVERFAQWRDYLEHFRPTASISYGANSEIKTCDVSYYDVPGFTILWENSDGTTYLGLDQGCDPEKHQELLEFFKRFPSMMGVKDFPKTDQWVAMTPKG